MATQARPAPQARSRARLVLGAALVALVVAMALDTTVVRVGSERDVRADVFSPEAYGAATFPEVRTSVETRAVDAQTLAAAIEEDKAAASEEYGVAAGIGAVMPVTFEGVVGEGKAGVYDVAVEGLPETLRVRVQMGPAVNGTDLRDATGTIAFGQFKNQIEYQNAGAAINTAMKAAVLEPLDRSELAGRSVAVTGVFKLVNPKSWLVTPVRLAVR